MTNVVRVASLAIVSHVARRADRTGALHTAPDLLYGPPMRTRVGLLLLGMLAAIPLRAAAQPVDPGTQPYTLEGVVAKDQATAQQEGWFAISAGVVDSAAPPRWLGVTAFRNFQDDPFVGREALRRLLPSQPTLLFVGPPPLIQQFQNAPPGTRLVIRGMLNAMSRNFMLSAIKVVAPEGK